MTGGVRSGEHDQIEPVGVAGGRPAERGGQDGVAQIRRDRVGKEVPTHPTGRQHRLDARNRRQVGVIRRAHPLYLRSSSAMTQPKATMQSPRVASR